MNSIHDLWAPLPRKSIERLVVVLCRGGRRVGEEAQQSILVVGIGVAVGILCIPFGCFLKREAELKRESKQHVMWAKNRSSRRDLRPTRFRFGSCFPSRTAGHDRSFLRPRFSHLASRGNFYGKLEEKRKGSKNSLFWPLRAILQLV